MDLIYLTKEAIDKLNITYDPDVVEESGMSEEEINEQFIAALFAFRKNIESMSYEECRELVMSIMIKRYKDNLQKKRNMAN